MSEPRTTAPHDPSRPQLSLRPPGLRQPTRPQPTRPQPSPGPPSRRQPVASPLSEATFLILLSIADTPRHGYAIVKAVRLLSGGRITLGTGTLYGAIKRLQEDGWIVRVSDVGADTADAVTHGRLIVGAQNAPADVRLAGPESALRAGLTDRRARKTYALTDEGRCVLMAEIERLRRLVQAAAGLSGEPA